MTFKTAILLLVAVLALRSVAAEVCQVALPYAFDDLEPQIDAKTVELHYGTHYKGYVDNLNKATRAAGGGADGDDADSTDNNGNKASQQRQQLQDQDLTSLIQQVNSLKKGSSLFKAVRNQGGGAWNHALYFKHLAPSGSAHADPSKSLSGELAAAIDKSFGSLKKMQDAVSQAGKDVFGSGWAWLCYTDDKKKLVVTKTSNQDNPLMGDLPDAPDTPYSGCTPILGLDVWEHSYYLKHGPNRAAYIDNFWEVVNWKQISKNFAAAQAGKIQSLVE